MEQKYLESIQRFKNFVAFRNKVSLILSLIVLVCYYAFLLSIGIFPEVLGYRVGPSAITLGIILGIFLIVLCVVATGLYTFFANWYFDKIQKEVIEDLEKSGALEDLKNGKIKE
ncbi:DUF485 domain-containing protein [Helicobacter canadensis]|uniref:DUF485 domain-containing protein n=1 Tax=Helicobacter canadensis MIT 98-5491 TaxID=537970 RepID=C5ZWC8_9HELI|nr:DUF485 domain-containing protein [Helicobacter canadensis]EES89446.1 conserved hypothetical protein [Helicobacter canadensis MIT 98-5491]EFR48237.1 hypothetical protein HCMG_00410 [Helicobacter canadensis MIT 98-5491]STO99485.1 Inner membrane protein yjcH [Helicobacter canadensis]